MSHPKLVAELMRVIPDLDEADAVAMADDRPWPVVDHGDLTVQRKGFNNGANRPRLARMKVL